MSPRADEPPRRGFGPRRGVSRDVPVEERDEGRGRFEERDDDGRRGFGIGEARAYTPRGRSVAERDQRTRSPRAARNADPFRPALQVLDGGRGRGRVADEPAPGDEAAPDPRQPRAGGSRGRGREAALPERDPDRDLADDRRDGARRGNTRRAGGSRGRGREAALPERDPDSDDEGRESARRGNSRRAGVPRDRAQARGRAERRVIADGRGRGGNGRAGKLDPAEKRVLADARGRGGNGRAGKLDRGEKRDRADGPGRYDSGTRTDKGRRTGRERTVATPPGQRRAAGGRPAGEGRPTKRAQPARPRPVKSPPPEPPKLANSTRRLRLGTVLALTLFATIGIRLVVLQVVESPAEAKTLLEQRQNRLTEVVLPAARGSILDRSGAVLAQSVEARYVYADPELVRDPAAEAARLSPLLGMAPSKLTQLMAKKKRPGGGWSRFEYLARGVDIQVADTIVSMNLPGIGEGRDERRDVPGADLAANLIGFTGEDHTGLEGLEARYDDLLRGTDGERVYETGNPNAEGGKLAKEIPGGYHRETPAQPGTSLELTIDRDLQFEVQRYLSDDMTRVRATIGAAVVLDVQTGEVLAQASYPAYNAAKPFDAKPADRDDVASSVVFDPGSSHKPFVLGAALQEGLITPQSTITVGPALSRGGYTFQDTHPQPKGTKLTIPGVLAYSSNVGTILIGDKLGPQRIYQYQQKFGLGQASGEGMPGEAPGRLLAPDQWSGSASGSIPIGMSVDATLLQMAAGYATIANNGTYVQPHLIRATIASDGQTTPAPAPETHPVLSPDVASELRTMMEAVVDVHGATGTQAAVPGYRVAGKTGTGKRLIDGRYTSYNAGSFVGMAPADNPRFVIAVFADVPNGTGGTVAAPAFSKMMSFALAHYRVPPSGTKPPKFKIYP